MGSGPTRRSLPISYMPKPEPKPEEPHALTFTAYSVPCHQATFVILYAFNNHCNCSSAEGTRWFRTGRTPTKTGTGPRDSSTNEVHLKPLFSASPLGERSSSWLPDSSIESWHTCRCNSAKLTALEVQSKLAFAATPVFPSASLVFSMDIDRSSKTL